MIYRVLGISFSCRGLWHCINRVLTSIFLSCHIRIRSRRIDGILSISRFGVYFRLRSILLFASQVRVFLNRVLLSVRCLSDCILGISFSCWRLWHIIDGLRAFVLLSRYIRIACRGIDGILSLSRLGVYFSLSCVFLFASQVRIIFDGVLLSIGCLSDCILGVSFSCWRLWHIIDGFGAFVLLSRYIRIRSRCINGILSLCSFSVYLSLSCVFLFTS